MIELLERVLAFIQYSLVRRARKDDERCSSIRQSIAELQRTQRSLNADRLRCSRLAAKIQNLREEV